ncbi:MAG: hypothetical protein ABIY70_08250 [Capsulimonas sp.]|uniref:anti-sigma factor family protein n=1 Tax=Capsulimonas sp. TaxID=2494211 RepID=UPI003265E1B2
MNCRYLESLAADWAAGKLSANLTAQMESHGETCASCARLMRSEAQLRHAFRDWSREETSSKDLWLRMAHRLEPRRRRVLPAPRLVWSGAVALVVVALVTLRPPSPCSEHPVSVPVTAADTTPGASVSHVASADTLASWHTLSDVSTSNSAVDDPAGGSMEEIWTHLDSQNN